MPITTNSKSALSLYTRGRKYFDDVNLEKAVKVVASPAPFYNQLGYSYMVLKHIDKAEMARLLYEQTKGRKLDIITI